jgi:hypothetical protein
MQKISEHARGPGWAKNEGDWRIKREERGERER